MATPGGNTVVSLNGFLLRGAAIVTAADANDLAPVHGNIFDIETGMPHMPNITCAGGHKCSDDDTEYIDGEVISHCENCGERIILPRVPGRIPYLRLQAFVGVLTGLDVGVDEGISLSDILGMFGDLKEAIDTEELAVEHARELFEIAEAILRRKLAEAN
jgi:hypothetical protein